MCQFPIHVSIRASLQQRGELTLLILARNFLSVSIRASLQQRGERLVDKAAEARPMVSIRASLQQRGEPLHTYLYPSIFRVSIRASLQQRGEPWTKSFPSKKRKCFNPRLTSAARRTRSLFPQLRRDDC